MDDYGFYSLILQSLKKPIIQESPKAANRILFFHRFKRVWVKGRMGHGYINCCPFLKVDSVSGLTGFFIVLSLRVWIHYTSSTVAHVYIYINIIWNDFQHIKLKCALKKKISCSFMKFWETTMLQKSWISCHVMLFLDDVTPSFIPTWVPPRLAASFYCNE